MKAFHLPVGKVLVAATAAIALCFAATASQPALAVNSTFSMSPAHLPTPAPGSNFTLTVTQNTPATTTGAQTDLLFDYHLFQINAGTVVYDPAYTAVDWVQTAGTAGQTLAMAISEANTDGRLKNVAAYVNGPPGTATLSAGAHTFFTIEFHTQPGYTGTATGFSLRAPEVLDAAGNNTSVSIANATLTGATVGGVSEAPNVAALAPAAGTSSTRIILWAIAALAIGGAVVVAYRCSMIRASR